MEPKEIEYPKKGEKIFIEGLKVEQTACVGWNGQLSQFWGYIEGYKNAGDVIIKEAIEDGTGLALDTLVFPTIFCYRQYLELTLKYIIILGEIISTGQFSSIKGHGLKPLWVRCKIILDWYNEGKDKQFLNIIEEYILDFDTMDPNSVNFRYPIDKDGNPIHSNRKTIDLVNLRDRMNELYNFFDGCQHMIDHVNDNILEMKQIESELKREIEQEMMGYWE
jgi:hypothetical protein